MIYKVHCANSDGSSNLIRLGHTWVVLWIIPLVLLTDITKYTNPIIVGEPSGSKPNHIGEAGWFKLPYSGLMGLISTQFHQTSKAEDNRKWIAPHIPISLSSIDYFNGNDKALNIINEVIKEK